MIGLVRVLRTALLAAGGVIGAAIVIPGGVAQAQGAAALYVAAQGDDHHDGSSPAKALRTISAALSRAQAGDTVFIGPGTYAEQIITTRGGTPGAEITIKALDGKAVIDGTRLDWRTAANQNQGLVELRHPFVRLVGLTIENSKNTGVILAANNLTVEDCTIVSTQLHAISTDTEHQMNRPGSNGSMIREVVLRNNVVEKASLAGNSQAISLIADGFKVIGNTVRDSQREGIDIWLGARHGEVQGNTVYGNAAAGIFVDGASYVAIHHNVVYRNRAGIGVSSEDRHYTTQHIWVYDNIAYDNREGGIFLWDDKYRPGHDGVQDVLVAYNTMIGNKYSIYLAGLDTTARILNNLGYATRENFQNDSAHSSFAVKGNVWLAAAEGFAAVERKDFRLVAGSRAIDQGTAIPPVKDDGGKSFSIATDFEGSPRIFGGKPDAGAYEYSGR